MRNPTWKIALPLAVISFATFTKWWYAFPEDAPDTLYWGFPFPFAGEGWHTSMSFQVFVLELLADGLIYFLFWFLVVWVVQQLLHPPRFPRIIVAISWILSALTITAYTTLLYSSNSIFHWRRAYTMEIMDEGFRFIWQQMSRPVYDHYRPEEKEK